MDLGRHGVALVLGLAVIGGSAAALVGGVALASSGGLTQQEVRDLVERRYGGPTPIRHYAWQTLQIGAPRAATAGEAAHARIAPASLVYPVQVAFTATEGGGADMLRQRVAGSYLVYRDGHGEWAGDQTRSR